MKNYYINTNTRVLKSSGKNHFKIPAFFLIALTLFFSVLSSNAQTVNKRLYLKNVTDLNRTVPVGATVFSTASLSKSSAVFVTSATNATSNSGNSGSMAIASYTVAAGTNRLLLVSIASNNAVSVTSVTFGAQLLSKYGEQVNANSKAELWYLKLGDGASGTTAAITANWTGTLEAVIGAVNFTGVDQTVPLGTLGSATGTTSPLNLSTPSNLGDIVVDVSAKQGTGPALSAALGQTSIFINGTNNVKGGSSYKTATAGSTSMSWSYGGGSSANWSILGAAIKGITTTASFTQSTAMCSSFTIKAGSDITVLANAAVTSGTASGAALPMTVRLKKGSAILWSSSSATNAGLGANGTTGTLTWTGQLSPATDVTFNAGEAITAEFASDYSTANIRIDYDASTKISYIQLPTSTYVNINSLAIYNAAYPGGSIITQQAVGVTNYLRAVVSDPFGFADITGMDISVTGAATGSGTATSVTTSGCLRTYEYAWTPTVSGSYTLQTTAKEGTEGTVTHVSSTGFTEVQPSLTVTKTKTSPVSGPFTLNDNIVYNIAINNTGLSSLTLLPLQDTYSTSCLQYVSSSVTPTNISGGVITWNNLGPLTAGSTLNVTLTMKVIGNCDPATNTATVAGAKDGLNYVATTQASSLNINIDQPPVAIAENYCIQASTPLSVLSNDTDPDVVGFLSANTGLYTVSITTPPAKGSVTVNGDKTIQFNPAGGTAMSENNTVTFVYRVTEIANPTYFSEATVTVLFSAINSPPLAVSDIASTTTGKPVVINVLANDSDPDGILQTPTVTVQPLYGSVLVNTDKTITYTPFPGFEGTDSFTYQVCDNGCPTPALCTTATATITVVFAQNVCQQGTNTMSVPPISDAVSYTWTLPAGATVSSIYTGSLPNPTTTSPSITVNWSGVSAGNYSICALASNECGPGANQCTQLVVNQVQLAFAPTQIGCYGNSSGAINLTVSGGIPPYTYAWTRSGGYTASIEDISNLLPGTYNVTVTDNFGCTATGSSTITQPASPISISVNSITNENPYGSSNGAIDISVSGGTPGYTYSWSNGATTQDISGLTGGTYSVTVTDLNGCTANQIFTVNRIGGPLAVSSLTKTDVLCNGGSTGSVNLEVIGGTSPYTYNWTKTGVTNPPSYSTNQDLSNIPAGTYSVLITDAVAATTTASITVNQPATSLSATNTYVNPSCNGAGNGSINVTVTGGTAPYTYLWNNGATTEDLSGLSPGTYTVTVTDKNGCTTTTSATITQPTALLLSGTVINSNCNTGNNGAINIIVSGGSGSFTFLWSNGATTQNVSGLPPGEYSVTATDGSGCKVSRAFSVGNSCLGAAKTISGTPINNGNGTYTLTYVIKVQNTGTVTLNNVQLTDNLATTFTGATSFAVNTISSGNFTVNNSFNGNGNNNLLASPLGSLLPGDAGVITLVMNVTPGTKLGTYNNNATASATDPNGLNVSDVSQNGTNVDPDSNGNPGNNSDPTPVTFTEYPLIGVAKELSSGPTINTDGSYNLAFTIRVHNYGDVPLKNVQVTDNLLTTFGAGAAISVTSLTSSDMDVNSAGYNGTTVANLLLATDVMAVNEVNTIQLSLKVTPLVAGPFNNSAIGTASGLGGTTTSDTSQNGVNPDPDNNSNPTDNNVPTPVSFPEHPQIGAAKLLVGLPVNNHDGTYSLTYEIRVKNTGDVNLYNIQVTDNFTTTFNGKPVTVNSKSSGTLTVNNSYNGVSDTNLLTATGNNLLVGETKIITLTVTVTPGPPLVTYNNTATATGLSIFGTTVSDVSNNGTDVDPENDGPGNNSVPTPVNFTETPKIGLAKAVSAPVNNHDGTYTLIYTIKVQNLGDVPVNNVQVTDNLGTTFSGSTSFAVIGVPSSSLPVNGSYNGTSNINLLSGTNTLAYATSATITVSVLVTPGSKLGVYNNSATGSATSAGGASLTDVSTNGTVVDPDNDGNPGNNSVTTPVSFNEDPQINISKSLTSGPTLSGGNYTLTYRLTVVNTGDVPLSNVQVVENLLSTFPSPASIVSATATSSGFTINGSYNGTTNTNLLSGGQTLLYGITKTIDVTVTVNPGGVGGPYVNEAFAYGQSPSGRFANNVSNTVSVTFFENPKIGIAKKFESVVDNHDGTNTVTFLLTIENFGDVELKDLKIYDDIVTQFSTVSPTAYFASGGTLFASGTWDGTSTSNILYSNQTLGVGQTATVIISFKVTPGTVCSLNNVASAKGTSPTLGLVSEDISTDGTDPDGSIIDNNPVEQVPTPVTVTVNPKPAINNLTATICSTGTFTTTPVNLTDGIVPAGTTYSWSAPSGTGFTGGAASSGSPTSISGTLTNTTNATVTATYTVTPTNVSCSGSTFTVTVTISPKPAINNLTATICSDGTFTATPINSTNGIVPSGTTYSWSAPTGTGFTGGAASSGSPTSISGMLTNTTNAAVTATYTVTPTSGTCTGSPFTVIVTVNPKPAIDNLMATICSTGTFTTTPVNGTDGIVPSGTTYSWLAPSVTGGITGGTSGSGATSIGGTLVNPTTSAQTAIYTITPVSGSCQGSIFTVTVTLNPTPGFSSCPSNITQSTATGQCSAIVSYAVSITGTPAPTVTYLFTGATTGSGSGTGSNSNFNKGVTTVVITAVNVCQTVSCSFTVTINDTENPTIACPANIIQSTNLGVCNASVAIPDPVTGDNCAVTALTWQMTGATTAVSAGTGINNIATYTFNKGVTTVIYTVKDAAGNIGTCSFAVTINDLENPKITCPSTVTVATNIGCNSAGVILGTPVTSDNCSVASVTNNHPSGTYPVGNTIVMWTATDASGNTATCAQTVTVTNTGPTAVPDNYTVLENTVAAPTSVSGNVVRNDTDPEGQTLTISSWGTPSFGGSLTTNTKGVFTYTPPVGFTGTSTFTYTLCDACGQCVSGLVTITVEACVAPPTIPGPIKVTK